MTPLVMYFDHPAAWLGMAVATASSLSRVTLRYHWRPHPGIQLEVQGRWREDDDVLVGAIQRRETFDWRARLTWMLQSG